MDKDSVPKASMQRIPAYFKYFQYLDSQGVKRILSSEISNFLKIDSTTVRKDFTYFDITGKRGYGYSVRSVLQKLNRIINQNTSGKVSLVGTGDMGNLIMKYNFNENNVKVAVAFDKDPEKIGKTVNGIPILDIKDFEKEIKKQDIDIAILAVPSENGKEVGQYISDAGIKGILNMTTASLELEGDVVVHDLDLAHELRSLIYFSREEKK